MITLPILIPFFVGILCLFCNKNTKLASGLSVLGAFVQLAVVSWIMTEVWQQKIITTNIGKWEAPYGIVLVADLFSGVMVLITAVVALAVNFFALRDVSKDLKEKKFFAIVNFLLMGVNGSFLTGDLFNLYVWFEVMLISSFVLITLGGRQSQLEGGVKYLVINLLASILFLCGLGLLYGNIGTLNMADIASKLITHDNPSLLNSSAMLIFVAFAIKSALFPFFFWLPAAYHTPNVTTSALFAGLLTKVGVYALMRSYTLIFGTQFTFMQGLFIFLAATTMLFGVFGAACQYDIKKILSFHIISQIGYIMMGLAIGTPLALAGAIFYTIHHIIVKTNLFLIGGLIERMYGTSDLKRLGGLFKLSPAFSVLFFVPAFSLGGIPPFSGFWAKLSVIRAGLEAEHYWLVGTALFVGVFTLFSMTKIWAEAFWKKQPEGLSPDWSKLSISSVAPCVGLVLCTLYLSFFGQELFTLAEAASTQLLNPEIYINAVFNR